MEATSSFRDQCQSLGKFFYTQNPFYLISCGFVMYGLQMVAASVGNQSSRASLLAGSLAIYTLMMAVTSIAVIRWAKVWDDARSILLVVVIGQVALSVSVDELCLSDPRQAAKLLAAGALGSFLVTEAVLFCCRIRFALSYRTTFYAVIGVFYAAPYLAGSFRAADGEAANWSALLFSIAVGLSLMPLIPAVRRGRDDVRDNGTPWAWPLFPLSLFAILLVLAGVRSHAIWMAFGSLRGSVNFEPLLLMPLLLAVLVLYLEASVANQKHRRTGWILKLSPLMLVGGVSSFGAFSRRSFESGLVAWGGSSMTVALVLLSLFYAYALVRRVRNADVMLALSWMVLAIYGREPTALQDTGFQPWMVAVLPCVLWFVRCLQRDAREWRWLGLVVFVSAAMLLVGREHDQTAVALAIAMLWTMLMLMFIGWQFDTVMAYRIRCVAAFFWLAAVGAAVTYHFGVRSADEIAPALAVIFVMTIAYGIAVRRLGWFALSVAISIAALMTSTVLSRETIALTSVAHHHWQLKTGVLFFVIGVMITSSKTDAYMRMLIRARKTKKRSGFVRGF